MCGPRLYADPRTGTGNANRVIPRDAKCHTLEFRIKHKLLTSSPRPGGLTHAAPSSKFALGTLCFPFSCSRVILQGSLCGSIFTVYFLQDTCYNLQSLCLLICCSFPLSTIRHHPSCSWHLSFINTKRSHPCPTAWEARAVGDRQGCTSISDGHSSSKPLSLLRGPQGSRRKPRTTFRESWGAAGETGVPTPQVESCNQW